MAEENKTDSIKQRPMGGHCSPDGRRKKNDARQRRRQRTSVAL
ncbi:MAG: hypothetical protein ACLRYY_06250 [Anaerobutyricum soehngenii]